MSKDILDKDLDSIIANEALVQTEVSKELSDSFMAYSVYSIVQRAIPYCIDGLKPVQRRLLYSMYKMGLKPTSSYKKSARVTGDVIGKYHPHGDQSVYGTMAKLVSPLGTRYPLVDGHGNFGNPLDGDGPAAQRYTECKLTKLAMELLEDIEYDTVDMVPNFSEDELEPTLLPSKAPLILLQNTTGIAVGYTTELPSHNMKNTCDTVIAYLKNNEISIEELVKKYLIGPDLPSYGYLINDNNIIDLYKTGKASLSFRGKVITSINKETNNNQVVITELPPDVNKPKMVEKIYNLYVANKDKRINDVRDESEGEEVKIVIELNKKTIPETIISELYEKTQLSKTKTYVLRTIVNKAPLLLNLKQILEQFIDHRRNVIIRRSKFKLNKINIKINILNGKAIISNDIRNAVNLIIDSESPDDAIESLINKYNLNIEQAKAIMEIPLRTLTKLESNKIINELNDLKKEADELNEILSNGLKVDQVIIDEMKYLKKEYGDERKTELIEPDEIKSKIIEPTKEDIEDIKEEPMFISLTNKDNIKVITYKELEKMFKNKLIKHKGQILTSGFKCELNDDVIIITKDGKMFKSCVKSLVDDSLEKNQIPVAILPVKKDELVFLVITKKGLYKKIKTEALLKVKKLRIIDFIQLDNDDEIIGVKICEDSDNSSVILTTNFGKVSRFPVKTTNAANSLTGKMFGFGKLDENEFFVAFDVVNSQLEDKYKVIQFIKDDFDQKLIKVTPISDFIIKGRSAGGVCSFKLNKKTTYTVNNMSIIYDNSFIINNLGKIKPLKYNKFDCTKKGDKPEIFDYDDILVTDFLV